MRRHILGAIGLAFLVAGVVQLAGDGWEFRDGAFFASVGLRVGILLLAIWLALPQVQDLLRRFPPWLLGTFGLGVLILVIRPRLFTVVLPILAVVIVLQFLGRMFGLSRRSERESRGQKDVGE